MESVVKVQRVKIRNLKNVRNGEITISNSFINLNRSNVMGIYGQNGSGKTTVILAFELLKILISSWKSSNKLPSNDEKMIHIDGECASLEFEFLVSNSFGQYFLTYYVELKEGEKYLYPVAEKITYRENIRGKRKKVLIVKENDDVQIRTIAMKSLKESARVRVMVVNELSKRENKSFIFHKELKKTLIDHLTEEEITLLENIAIDFNRNLHVINNKKTGLIMTSYIMPLSVHLDTKRGEIAYDLVQPALLPKNRFITICEVVEQTNSVLSTIIPGLAIKVQKITEQMLDNGDVGVRFEFLSQRGDRLLPLRTESEGILKIISVLSALVAVYNKPAACVLIDELDSGVFEYLLGELLGIIEENGKGQLFFTSHNLRILEVLPIGNLWFTTANENNRYLQLKGMKTITNTRDMYLRAIQVGGQDERIYEETSLFQMKRAFRKAGKPNE
ncbi:ATP-binding protein [Lysinibacillus sp. 54212]|uniref:ATP-binding protein n=1 Tax=Lysinibacillus sp. 54212 TaxID=3119829 RepID=UPI002FCAA9ED